MSRPLSRTTAIAHLLVAFIMTCVITWAMFQHLNPWVIVIIDLLGLIIFKISEKSPKPWPENRWFQTGLVALVSAFSLSLALVVIYSAIVFLMEIFLALPSLNS